MNYTLEHVAFNVRDMEAVVSWYTKNLGLTVVRQVPGTMAFLADASGRVVFEIYSRPTEPRIDDPAPHAYTLHNAFVVDDVAAARKQLLAAGATVVADVQVTAAGDELLLLADPFGLGLQAIKRKVPMA